MAYTLTAVNTPAELGDAATHADMAAWNQMVADHPQAGEEVSEAEFLALLDSIAITDAQIETLSAEAGEAGDLEQVTLCQQALEGDAGARAKCERVIRAAQAQGE